MIVLYDDARARAFEPFATSRPLGEVRAGALLGRERWQMALGAPTSAFVGAAHLHRFVEFGAPPAAGTVIDAGVWLVNTRALPEPRFDENATTDVIHIGGRVAAVRLRTPLHATQLAGGNVELETLVPSDANVANVPGVWLTDLWDVIRHLTTQLTTDIPLVARALQATRLTGTSSTQGPVVIGAGDVWIEDGAVIEPLSVLDTTSGPILVRRGASVQAFTRLCGPAFIGCNSTVSADRIAACSIGDDCRVHGELSMSVFIGHSNKGHVGFVGHSLLGRWVNLGAGTTTSNLKNSYGPVAMWSTDGIRDTGLQFAGTFFGDHVKTGIGLQLTTGCVLGAGANVMESMPPKCVAPFAWGTGEPYSVFQPAKFVEIAARMMSRRNVLADDRSTAYLRDVMARAATAAYWPDR
jgi:UDP-N-acetylglucosamine diphosphorylase/glucosamine-1-phosphate N-acetyltransferase